MGYIENIHKENFENIEKYNIQIGTILTKEGQEEVVKSIHPMYGWILTDKWKHFTKVPQEVGEIIKQGWEITQPKEYVKDYFKTI